MIRLALCTSTVFFCSIAAAQIPPRPSPLTPVEQGVDDINPLATSLREVQIELWQPIGFRNVYEVPGHEGKYMRVSGALHAVFPQSQYIPTRQGMMPIVPAGTVYYIGLPPVEPILDDEDELLIDANGPLTTEHVSRLGGLAIKRINSRVNTKVAELTPEEEIALLEQTAKLARERHNLPTVASDPNYCVQRIAQLVQRAASASADRSGTGSPSVDDSQ